MSINGMFLINQFMCVFIWIIFWFYFWILRLLLNTAFKWIFFSKAFINYWVTLIIFLYDRQNTMKIGTHFKKKMIKVINCSNRWTIDIITLSLSHLWNRRLFSFSVCLEMGVYVYVFLHLFWLSNILRKKMILQT